MVFLNDQFVPDEKAVLHCSDLSVERGYGVFDFLKIVDSIPVFLQEHLNRFYFSAQQMRLNVGYSKEELKKIIFELAEKNNAVYTGVRITLTGGYSADGFELSKPNLIILLRSFHAPDKDQFEKGIKLVTYPYQRQLPQVKTIDYLMAIWLQPLLKQNNADDILYHQNERVTECPRSNFFIVTQDNQIVTSSKNILKGIVRAKLIEMASANFEIEERELSIEEIKSAREAFITSTTKTILPVHQIDDHVFAGKNWVTSQLYHSFLHLQFKLLQN